MAQPATNPKIEELRFKLKADPKSRLFYQLAEELRKAGQLEEAEQYLHNGLGVYPTYLAAWVSLGRLQRDRKNDGAAVEALNKALQLDPGNVVAARLLADAYLALGEKVEAIKKYKLVLALLPSDEDLRVHIEQIDRELHLPAPEEPAAAASFSAPLEVTEEVPLPVAAPQEEAPEALPPLEESPFDRTLPPFDDEARVDVATADVEPMSFAHEESPFEEPVSTFTADSVEIEQPAGFSIEPAPLEAEEPAPVDAAPVFDTETPLPPPEADDAGNTLTMADLYARQGAVEDARHIYENILARDPENTEVRAKLDTLTPRVNPKVAHLERWLAKVSKREVGRV